MNDYKTFYEYDMNSSRYSYLAFRVIIIIILALSFYNYWQLQEYLAPNNDKAYYLAVAEGLDETGRLEDRIVHPYEAVLSTQNGTVFIYTLFRQFTNNNDYITLLASLTGFLMLAISLIIAYRMALYLGLSEFMAHFLVFMMVFNASYLHFSFMGMTESFFYPLSLIWTFYHIKFLDTTQSPKLITWVIFIVLSYLLIQFRTQGLLLFAASFLFFLLKGNWRRVFQVSIIYIVTLISMLSLFYYLSGSFLGPGETGHLSNITQDRSNFIVKIIGFVQMYITNLTASYDTIRGSFLMLVSLPGFALVFLGGIRRIFDKNLDNYTLLYLIFAISVTALWLFKPGMALRYVYYTYPIFILLFLRYLVSINSKITRYLLYGLLLLTILNLGYIFYNKQIVKEYQGKQMIADRVHQHKILKKLYKTYQPATFYMSEEHGYHRRLVYTPTAQPVETRQDTGQIVSNSFVIGDEQYLLKFMSSSHIDSSRMIGQFIYDGVQHKVYLIK